MKIVNRIELGVALGILVACGAGFRQARSLDQAAPAADLCDVLRTPSKYAGKTITVVARVTSTKEGGFLWSPACSKRRVRLIIDRTSGSAAGTTDLLAALRKHGLSDRPVIATLTGLYISDYYDDRRNRHYPVFSVIGAANVRRSHHVERP